MDNTGFYISGLSGVSGFSGKSGTSGATGSQGSAGSQGTSGTSGATGSQGVSGTSGFSGASGTSGFSGASGTSGVSGFSGKSGFSGASGTSGFSGKSGFSGTSGTIPGPASAIAAGSMSAEHFILVENATNENTVDTLVLRDGGGSIAVGQLQSDNFTVRQGWITISEDNARLQFEGSDGESEGGYGSVQFGNGASIKGQGSGEEITGIVIVNESLGGPTGSLECGVITSPTITAALDRANHTGTQAAGTITGLATSATTDTTNASNIGSGSLADARLSANVPLKNGANTFTNTLTLSGNDSQLYMTRPNNANYVEFRFKTGATNDWTMGTRNGDSHFHFFNFAYGAVSFIMRSDGHNVAATRIGTGGNTPTAFLDAAASTTAASSLRIRSGTAPTSPNDGDIWFDGTDLKIRISGTTKTITVS